MCQITVQLQSPKFMKLNAISRWEQETKEELRKSVRRRNKVYWCVIPNLIGSNYMFGLSSNDLFPNSINPISNPIDSNSIKTRIYLPLVTGLNQTKDDLILTQAWSRWGLLNPEYTCPHSVLILCFLHVLMLHSKDLFATG